MAPNSNDSPVSFLLFAPCALCVADVRVFRSKILPPRRQTSRSIIDSDLADGYRFGIKREEIAHMSDKIKNLFSLRNANKMEIHAFRKRNHLAKFGATIHDTGRTEVQGLFKRESLCIAVLILQLFGGFRRKFC